MKRVAYKGKFLQVKEEPYNGINYEIVEMGNAVAAFIVNKELTKVLLAKQYRPVCNDFTYEIPAGMLDVEGENERDCVAREIIEEVDLEVNPENLVYLTKYIPIVGSVRHEITLYYCSIDETDNARIENDDVVERVWVNLSDFDDLIKEGKLIDGKTLLAYYMVKDKVNQSTLKDSEDC